MLGKNKPSQSEIDGVQYRRAKLCQIILYACNGFVGMSIYSLIGMASYSASTRFGCRKFEIDAQKGFLLNGRSYSLRGGSRHQDRKGAGNALTMEHHREDMEIILEIPDVNSYNLYFGWYLGELEQNEEFFDEYHAKFPDRCIGFSEYGADANPQFQSPTLEKGDYTESYQCLYHEHMLEMIEKRPWLCATHVWNIFDFAADGRDEGGKHGENQKGLVTFDRQTKKDAFYLYKAYWNKTKPFVHIAGGRYVDRVEPITEIKVYSNQPSVSLSVDGKPFETQSVK